jgi:hypothetical protein
MSLPLDIWREIAFHISIEEITNFSKLFPNIERECQKESFWREYILRNYFVTPEMTSSVNFKNLSGFEIAMLINNLLQYHFSHGRVVLCDSIKDLFSTGMNYARDLVSCKGSSEGVEKTFSHRSTSISAGFSFIFVFPIEEEVTIPFDSSLFDGNSYRDFSLDYGKEFLTYFYSMLHRPTLYFTPKGIAYINLDMSLYMKNFITSDNVNFNDLQVDLHSWTDEMNEVVKIAADSYYFSSVRNKYF